jgi:hypothetical protein
MTDLIIALASLPCINIPSIGHFLSKILSHWNKQGIRPAAIYNLMVMFVGLPRNVLVNYYPCIQLNPSILSTMPYFALWIIIYIYIFFFGGVGV